VLANVAFELTTVDVAGAVDRAGQTGWRTGTVPGVPDYTIDGIATWTKDQFQLTAHGRYIPSGIFWTNFIGPDQEGYAINLPTSVDDNRVPARFYLDLAFQVRVPLGNREMEFFGAVNNVLDRDPPVIPSNTGGTNQILFDPVGRAFRAGVRVRFGG
jgi:outer membrane receptor protein involved in Fe transport